MRDGSSFVSKCLLYKHGPLTDLARVGQFLCGYNYAGQIENFLYKSLVQGMPLLPQRRESLQGCSAVFFSALRPYWEKICST